MRIDVNNSEKEVHSSSTENERTTNDFGTLSSWDDVRADAVVSSSTAWVLVFFRLRPTFGMVNFCSMSLVFDLFFPVEIAEQMTGGEAGPY
jgi:hypothetical protein